jgi:hypothetical protein
METALDPDAVWRAAVVTVTDTVALGVAVALNVSTAVPCPPVMAPPPATDQE